DSAEDVRYDLDLPGSYQTKNLPAVLSAVEELRRQGFNIANADVEYALAHVQQLTGLMGRWQTVDTHPLIICDTGHNVDGWREVLANIAMTKYETLHMVFGMMRDKEPGLILPMLPKDARYYFCQVAMPRALPAEELRVVATDHGLAGDAFTTVGDALTAARQSASTT